MSSKKVRVGGVSLRTFQKRVKALNQSAEDVMLDADVDFNDDEPNTQTIGTGGLDSDDEQLASKTWDDIWKDFRDSDDESEGEIEIKVDTQSNNDYIVVDDGPTEPAKRQRLASENAPTVQLDHGNYIRVKDPLRLQQMPKPSTSQATPAKTNGSVAAQTAGSLNMTCSSAGATDPMEGSSKTKTKLKRSQQASTAGSLSRFRQEFHRQKNSSDQPTIQSVHSLLMAFAEYTVGKIQAIEDRQIKIQNSVNRISMATMAIATYEAKEIPIDDIGGAKSLEKSLRSNEDVKANLIKQMMRKKEGKTDDEGMNGIFRLLFTDRFINGYNLLGTSGRSSFASELKYFYSLIMEVWRHSIDVDPLIRSAIMKAKCRQRKLDFQKRQQEVKALEAEWNE